MTWTSPRTWIAGEVVSAALMNTHLRDNLIEVGPNTGSGWTSYTPTTTGITLGNGTITAAWSAVGKTINFRIYLVFGTTTAFPGPPTFSVPVAEKAGLVQAASCTLLDVSALAYFYATTRIGSGVFTPHSSGGLVGATLPFTWASTDQMALGGSYEAA